MTRLMQELVEEMNYLEKTDDLTFPLEEKMEVKNGLSADEDDDIENYTKEGE